MELILVIFYILIFAVFAGAKAAGVSQGCEAFARRRSDEAKVYEMKRKKTLILRLLRLFLINRR